MTGGWSYVIAGWAVVGTTLGAYATAVVVWGRRLAAQVPPERRRWMEADR